MSPTEANALDRYLTTAPEELYEDETDETIDYDKDSMGETIAQEDGVFQILYTVTTLNEKHKWLHVETKRAIVTQQDIVDFIEEVGEEKIKQIDYLGLGSWYLKL